MTKTEGGEPRGAGGGGGGRRLPGHNMLIGSLQLTAIRKVEAICRRITRKGMVRKMIMVSLCGEQSHGEDSSLIPSARP